MANRIALLGRKRVGAKFITASASRINPTDSVEARIARQLRQPWQLLAMLYRDSLPEINYAMGYRSQSMARIRFMPMVLDLDGETDKPISLTDAQAPPAWIDACHAAMSLLGNGRPAIANFVKSLSMQLDVPGEGYILGRWTPTGQEWSVRSIQELIIVNNQFKLREGPINMSGDLGAVPLPMATTFLERVWRPHPFWREFADSPMRAVNNDCDTLLILRRVVRALARSRLGQRGILAMPQELSLAPLINDSGDVLDDPFMSEWLDVVRTAISDEGDAAAIVPPILRGPAEFLDKVRFIQPDLAYDSHAGPTRLETIGNIATGLDLPREILEGAADINHWGMWQVDADTFRSHLEPHAILLCDVMTEGFFQPVMATSGLPPSMISQWLARTVIWYDPVELVTPPDQTENTKWAHQAIIISDAAARKRLNFTEDDAPTPGEIEVRMIRTTKTWPPNVLAALLHELDPNLVVPAMAGPPAIPGISAGGVTTPIELGGDTPTPASPALPTGGKEKITPTPKVDQPVIKGPPQNTDVPSLVSNVHREQVASFRRMAIENPEFATKLKTQLVAELITRGYPVEDKRTLPASNPSSDEWPPDDGTYPKNLTAAGRRLIYTTRMEALREKAKPKVVQSSKSHALCRTLGHLDHDLTLELRVAANAAMLRILEKAGARVRTAMNPDKVLKASLKNVPDYAVSAVVGRERVEARSLTAAGLTATDWSALKAQWDEWVPLAQRRALAIAASLLGDDEMEANVKAVTAMADGAQAGWELLAHNLDKLAEGLLYNPSVNDEFSTAAVSANADTLVPTGLIRAAIGVAGGSSETIYGMIPTKAGVDVPGVSLGVPIGGIGTGTTIGDLMTDAGATAETYEWVHGGAVRPFEPHENLDGLEFSSFTDDALLNTGDFPAVQYFMAGDHDGCTCNVTPLWVTQADVDAARAAAAAGDGE